jgi:hypothetical protein
LVTTPRLLCQNLHHDPRSGRPSIDRLDAKIIARLVREPFSLAQPPAEALDVWPATVLSRLHNSLEMKNFHLRWVPHLLTDDLQQVRVAKRREPLRALKAIQRTHFATLSQARRTDFTSNMSTPHNGRPLAAKCLKGWTPPATPLNLCSRLFGHQRLPPARCDVVMVQI